jgi:hypothetical protein
MSTDRKIRWMEKKNSIQLSEFTCHLVVAAGIVLDDEICQGELLSHCVLLSDRGNIAPVTVLEREVCGRRKHP